MIIAHSKRQRETMREHIVSLILARREKKEQAKIDKAKEQRWVRYFSEIR